MVDAYLGEIRAFPYHFVPRNWALCDGSLVKISTNTALFVIIGNNFYGGDGKVTFALPNLVDRVAMGVGMAVGMNNNTLGEQFGWDTVALREGDMPPHRHKLQRKGHGMGAKTAAPSPDAFIGQVLIADGSGRTLRAADSTITAAATNTTLDPRTVGVSGAGMPHNNLQPYLKLAYCICVQGIFPTK